MKGDETSSASKPQTSFSLCPGSETTYSDEVTAPFSDGLCPRCQDLKIHDQYLGERRSNLVFRVPYSLGDSLPDLSVLSRSARHGCKFCELLKSIIVEFVTHNQHHQWLGNSVLSAWLPSYKWSHSGTLSYLELVVTLRELPHLEKSIECAIYFEVEPPRGKPSTQKIELLISLTNRLRRK